MDNNDAEDSGLLREVVPVSPSTKVELSRSVLLCVFLYLLSSFHELIIIAPTTTLIERTICQKYFKLNDPGAVEGHGKLVESMCKIDAIQQELIVIRGWKAMFDGIPVFVLATFLDPLMKRLGPSKLLLTSFGGVALSLAWILIICAFPDTFPLRLIWLSSIFLFLGGGLSQIAAIIHLITSEFAGISETSRAFYYLNAVYMLDELLAPGLASITMTKSLWIPFAAAFTSILVGIITVLFLPINQPQQPPMPLLTSTFDTTSIPSEDSGAQSSIRSLHNILRSQDLFLSLPVFFCAMFKFATLNVLLQYTSLRFDWTVAGAAGMLSVISAFNFFLFFAIVPALMSRARKNHVNPEFIDLWIVRYALLASSFGSLFMALAPNIELLALASALFATAGGIRPPMLALATSWVNHEDRPYLYGVIQIVENIALMISGPILQNAFGAALKLSRFWYGITFSITFVLFSVAFTCSKAMTTEATRR